MTCRFDLKRFVDAQSPVFDQVCSELRAGQKRSHWMWYIFPQISGLGSSEMAQTFAISSLGEAAAYLGHPVLGPRLQLCTELVNAVEGRSVEQIFGYPDHLKFHSSMTLFCELRARGVGLPRCPAKVFCQQPRSADTRSNLRIVLAWIYSASRLHRP